MNKNGINLSETFKLNKGQVSFSPNLKYIANASQFRLVIRDFETLQIINVFTCIDQVDLVLWAPNSSVVLVSCFKRNISQIWAIDKPKWKCKLDEGSSGLCDALWVPDSAQVLTWSEFDIRINVWSLSDKNVKYIQSPKLRSNGCKFYTSKAIICERRDESDFISIFDYKTWKLLCNFRAASNDLAFIIVINNSIFIGDAPLNPFYYSYSFSGECMRKVQLYQDILGIKSFSSSPSEQFIALGCHDNTCKLVNTVTWSILSSMAHVDKKLTSKTTVCYQEMAASSGSHYEVVPTDTFTMPLVKSNFDDPYLFIGLGIVKFSSSGRFLAARSDSSPTLVWIWDLTSRSLISLLSQVNPVVSLAWDPGMNRENTNTEFLVVGCNTDHVYLWSERGVVAVKIPNCTTLNGAGELGPIRDVTWSDGGNCLILKGDYHFCLAYFPDYDLK